MVFDTSARWAGRGHGPLDSWFRSEPLGARHLDRRPPRLSGLIGIEQRLGENAMLPVPVGLALHRRGEPVHRAPLRSVRGHSRTAADAGELGPHSWLVLMMVVSALADAPPPRPALAIVRRGRRRALGFKRGHLRPILSLSLGMIGDIHPATSSHAACGRPADCLEQVALHAGYQSRSRFTRTSGRTKGPPFKLGEQRNASPLRIRSKRTATGVIGA